MQTVLITGGADFIDSSFIPFYLEKNKDLKIVNLYVLTYAGDLSNLKEVEKNTNYIFVKDDVCDIRLVEKYRFNGGIHFAVESHVDNSIKNPDNFYQN